MNRSNGIASGRSARDGDGERPRAGAAAPVDPDEQRDQEERRHDERVSLLDPVRELRRERGDDEQSDRQRDRHGEEGRARPPTPAMALRAARTRREREDAEIEIELGQVVDEEAARGRTS